MGLEFCVWKNINVFEFTCTKWCGVQVKVVERMTPGSSTSLSTSHHSTTTHSKTPNWKNSSAFRPGCANLIPKKWKILIRQKKDHLLRKVNCDTTF